MSFSDLLERAQRAWAQRSLEDGVLSLALPVQGLDPLHQLVDLEAHDPSVFCGTARRGFA